MRENRANIRQGFEAFFFKGRTLSEFHHEKEKRKSHWHEESSTLTNEFKLSNGAREWLSQSLKFQYLVKVDESWSSIKQVESITILPSFFCRSHRETWASPWPLSGDITRGQEQRKLKPQEHQILVRAGLPSCLFFCSKAVFRPDISLRRAEQGVRRASWQAATRLTLPFCTCHPSNEAPFPSFLHA